MFREALGTTSSAGEWEMSIEVSCVRRDGMRGIVEMQAAVEEWEWRGVILLSERELNLL